MNLSLNPAVASQYKSTSQIARVMTESWATENLYCAACSSLRIEKTPNNSEASDFICPQCRASYELKAGQKPLGSRVPDAGYDAMVRAVNSGRAPNLLVMRYSLQRATVLDLMLIPCFTLSASAILPRKPLAPSAGRAGWVGCDISLAAIPEGGRIRLISNSQPSSATETRRKYETLRPLQGVAPLKRGWTLDVLRIIGVLGFSEFSLQDVYRYEEELRTLHPTNYNIRAKIRQQLQVLRDHGFISFLGKGIYQSK